MSTFVVVVGLWAMVWVRMNFKSLFCGVSSVLFVLAPFTCFHLLVKVKCFSFVAIFLLWTLYLFKPLFSVVFKPLSTVREAVFSGGGVFKCVLSVWGSCKGEGTTMGFFLLAFCRGGVVWGCGCVVWGSVVGLSFGSVFRGGRLLRFLPWKEEGGGVGSLFLFFLVWSVLLLRALFSNFALFSSPWLVFGEGGVLLVALLAGVGWVFSLHCFALGLVARGSLVWWGFGWCGALFVKVFLCGKG